MASRHKFEEIFFQKLKSVVLLPPEYTLIGVVQFVYDLNGSNHNNATV